MTRMSPEGCPRTEEAGAYLIGSLHPTERADYAEHLPNCPYCLREVGQLAGLPGLLARSPGPPSGSQPVPVVAAAPWAAAGGEGDPGPVVAALREIRRQRARRRGLVAASLVLVGFVGVGGTAMATGALRGPSTGVTAAAALPVQMEPEGGAEATAAVALNAKAWGTEVVMRCRYQGTKDWVSPVYTLVAKGVDGSNTELARWTAIPDKDVVLAAATDLTRQQLAGLEVHDARGDVVLRTVHI
ncbi:MAG: anti-sigma factor [Pseudonocardia sp.]|nr:anti-sigma factor [Pseudonocardia sp.]